MFCFALSYFLITEKRNYHYYFEFGKNLSKERLNGLLNCKPWFKNGKSRSAVLAALGQSPTQRRAIYFQLAPQGRSNYLPNNLDSSLNKTEAVFRGLSFLFLNLQTHFNLSSGSSNVYQQKYFLGTL